MDFRCSKCDSSCENEDTLLSHISVRHLGWLPFECLYCESLYATKTEVLKHLDIQHKGEKQRFVSEEDDAKAETLQKIFQSSLNNYTPQTKLSGQISDGSASNTNANMLSDLAATSIPPVVPSAPTCTCDECTGVPPPMNTLMVQTDTELQQQRQDSVYQDSIEKPDTSENNDEQRAQINSFVDQQEAIQRRIADSISVTDDETFDEAPNNANANPNEGTLETKFASTNSAGQTAERKSFEDVRESAKPAQQDQPTLSEKPFENRSIDLSNRTSSPPKAQAEPVVQSVSELSSAVPVVELSDDDDDPIELSSPIDPSDSALLVLRSNSRGNLFSLRARGQSGRGKFKSSLFYRNKPPATAPAKPKYACRHCGFASYSRDILSHHLEASHFVCRKCPFLAHDQTSLQLHVESCTGPNVPLHQFRRTNGGGGRALSKTRPMPPLSTNFIQRSTALRRWNSSGELRRTSLRTATATTANVYPLTENNSTSAPTTDEFHSSSDSFNRLRRYGKPKSDPAAMTNRNFYKFCVRCRKECVNEVAAKQHLMERHLDVRDHPYLCPHCPNRGPTESTVVKHIRVHHPGLHRRASFSPGANFDHILTVLDSNYLTRGTQEAETLNAVSEETTETDELSKAAATESTEAQSEIEQPNSTCTNGESVGTDGVSENVVQKGIEQTCESNPTGALGIGEDTDDYGLSTLFSASTVTQSSTANTTAVSPSSSVAISLLKSRRSEAAAEVLAEDLARISNSIEKQFEENTQSLSTITSPATKRLRLTPPGKKDVPAEDLSIPETISIDDDIGIVCENNVKEIETNTQPIMIHIQPQRLEAVEIKPLIANDRCTMCSFAPQSKDYESLRVHAHNMHFDEPRYLCSVCGFWSAVSRRKVTKHVTQMHSTDSNAQVIDRSVDSEKKIQLLVNRCFYSAA